MKLIYALAFIMAPFAASAATVTLTGTVLENTETEINGELAYQIDLASLGFQSVTSVTLADSAVNTETGGQTTGFDLDALVIGPSTTSFTEASSYIFQAGGVSSGTQLFGATAGNAAVNDSVATLGVFDGQTSPLDGFLSLGNGGSLTAIFDPAVAVDGTLFIFAREIGRDEFLESVTIAGVVPLPAGGLLLLSGLAGMAVYRRRRRAA